MGVLRHIVFVFLLSAPLLNAQNTKVLQQIESVKSSIYKIPSRDSVAIAETHYKIGELYRKSLFSDSALVYFQKAEKVFRAYNLTYNVAITMYGIAVCQTYHKDYTGSESTSIEVLTLLNTLNETNNVKQYKAYTYNNLGVVFDELDQFDQAIKYYQTSLNLKKELNGDYQRSIGLTLNNMLKVYRRAGKFNMAIKTYNEIYNDKNLIRKYPDVYGLALGNYAKTLHLSKKYEELPGLYLKALRIFDSINSPYNSIIIQQHLAEFYNDINKKDSARYYAYQAKDLSELYNNDDLLKSLFIIANIEEGETANKYLNAYIKLSDSLHKIERFNRDKLARIRFETDEIEKENAQKEKEVKLLFIISIIVITISILLYLFLTMREKNKILQFKQSQQESNEEIYNLMLSQNESIEEARAQEKTRISQELHDGVLGRLFGTRLSLDSLNMNTSTEAVKAREQYINELKDIEHDIRKVSHELNTDFVSGSGFIDIIKTLVETQTLSYNLQYMFNPDDSINWDIISNKTKIHIYRIIQEALHNIHKHANASFVKISFKLKKDVICIAITDNGFGFDVSKTKSGIGLKNINSRVKEINGQLKITSQKKEGTTLLLEAPMT
ncbi:tetratricopeptide repeat protein [Tamlana sp. 62-3]|uniref:Tetratricopeptide repeat protein n=1 Tax=Neotamlana sargassicola TaxID=2883125 RepID=A0A9X1I593_9FLAO|nr:tetratricopeptide repeat-containing sensor histidine kinase [Tamlana sargassicola]MCB4807568.1 tetratricopeptide repeat protein [Tamlana sargassicola]